MLKDNIDLSAVRQRIAGFVNGHNNDVTKIFENHAVLSVMTLFQQGSSLQDLLYIYMKYCDKL